MSRQGDVEVVRRPPAVPIFTHPQSQVLSGSSAVMKHISVAEHEWSSRLVTFRSKLEAKGGWKKESRQESIERRGNQETSKVASRLRNQSAYGQERASRDSGAADRAIAIFHSPAVSARPLQKPLQASAARQSSRPSRRMAGTPQ